MEKKFSNRANRSVFSREKAFIFSLKKVTNVVLVLLCTIVFNSCTEEIFKVEASSATDMLHSNDFSSRLGHTLAWWEGSAINGQGQKLSCRVEQNYVGEDTITVEVLGLPVVMMGDPTVNADGSVTITFSDGQRVTLTEGINASGIDFSAKRGEIYATLEQSSEGEMVKIHFPNHWEMTASSLPASVVKNAKGDEDIPFVYSHKAAAAPTPAPVEPKYRLRAEYVETEGGNSYYNVYAEKSVDGGSTWTEIDKYLDFIGERHGTWSPNVSTQLVNTYEFTTEDTTKSLATDEDRPGLGKSKRWTVKNISRIEYFWKDTFSSPADASGNVSKDIAGTQVQWLNAAVWSNPETGEDMTLNFTGGITTTHSVDKTTGIYTRVNSVLCNGEVVETQTGSVQLELAQ